MYQFLGYRDAKAMIGLSVVPVATVPVFCRPCGILAAIDAHEPDHTFNVNSSFCVRSHLRIEAIYPKAPQRLVLGTLKPKAGFVFQSYPELLVPHNLLPVAHGFTVSVRLLQGVAEHPGEEIGLGVGPVPSVVVHALVFSVANVAAPSF